MNKLEKILFIVLWLIAFFTALENIELEIENKELKEQIQQRLDSNV